MRIIQGNGKYEILSPGEYSQDPRIIELTGRVCYKSASKPITEETAQKFTKMLIGRDHESVLEHLPLVFEISPREYEVEEFRPEFKYKDMYSIITTEIAEAINDVKGIYWSRDNYKYYISFNLRSLRDWLRYSPGSLCNYFALQVNSHYKNLINDLFDPYTCQTSSWWSVCNSRVLSNGEINSLSAKQQLLHNYMTVKFSDISIGMSRESNRHRTFSISERSTRYVDATNGSFILPPHKKNGEYVETIYDDEGYKYVKTIYNKAHESTATYKTLRELNDWKKQDARQFLPLGIDTEVVYTGNLKAWKNFFKLRTHPASHWEIRPIARKLLDDCKERFPGVFNDVAYN